MQIDVEIQEPKKTGRPSEFSQEVMTDICERMSDGKSLREICDNDPNLPARRTILRWVKNDDSAKKLYDTAQQERMHWYADEIVSIAYDTSKDTIKGKDDQPLCNHEWINRSRLKVDSLKFLMSKLAPRTYGEKTQLELPAADNNAPLTISWEPRTIVRTIVSPIFDGNGVMIPMSDNEKLQARIYELEEQLGLREPPPQPPKQITYDPGPLPARIDPEVLARFLRMIKDNVPSADQRSPETVLDEVLSECESALKAKYGSDAQVGCSTANEFERGSGT